MRVLFLSNLYPPNVVGGYERLCHEVATEFAARGHAVTVLTSTYGGREASYPGQRVIREWELLAGADIYSPFPGDAAARAAANSRNLATLHRVLDDVRPDVIFAWNLFFLDGSILAALEASRYRSVVMLTDNWLLVMRNPEFVSGFFRDVVHGTGSFLPPPAPPAWRALAGRLKRRLQRLLGRTPPRRLEAVFGARFMRDFYAAGGARFRHHRVIHNGVRQAPRGGLPAPDRGALVRPGTLRLLFAGRLVDLKGADTAVRALALLDARALGLDRVTLTILGDGQDAAYLRRFEDAVAESGRAEDIERREVVPEAELPALFDAHDIYLFPSLYEPFSLTLIHALACGIPTIASDVGGNTEIVEHGRTGLLFRKGDAAELAAAIARLARDPALRARIAAEGQRAGGRFTFERMAGEMERFLLTDTDRA
ncbi:glycosyltransferase family 4 protein [Roseomonas haemaphysalidis]|uniref:Glycosyltransferase family 4 protein n=1 Tax=Roseomonas haemaphysalidis TaxID=2768162 RepID=A0ABS3KMV0_9PROT|nr:glycosyltransferase family 4 protein [Roseomonas haemaphysalidis]MBO1078793.1 glycosyltransferase family 4 protein [Roseomonas haemaphysalidis]